MGRLHVYASMLFVNEPSLLTLFVDTSVDKKTTLYSYKYTIVTMSTEILYRYIFILYKALICPIYIEIIFNRKSVDTVDKFPAHGAGGDCITLVVCRPLARRLVLT